MKLYINNPLKLKEKCFVSNNNKKKPRKTNDQKKKKINKHKPIIICNEHTTL